MFDKNRHNTSDEIQGRGTLRKRFFISPSQRTVFDENGEELGIYRAKRTKGNILFFV